MDKYDRELQRDLLRSLYECFPNELPGFECDNFENRFGGEDNFVANLYYLEGHGLIVSGVDAGMDGFTIYLTRLAITSKGIDFIRDDGGLSAILNVVTFRLHSETIGELEKIISSSSTATDEDKKKLLSQLRSLPGDAIKHLTLQLLGKGLESLPNAFHVIQTALRHL